jgi:5'-AMP-activated protein kinase catalytic alpha subunit
MISENKVQSNTISNYRLDKK